MGRTPTCTLPHVDSDKIQVGVAVWSEMQKAVTDALAAQRDITDKIAQAIEAERAAARALRSADATGVQHGNQLLREQLAAANEDARDRDRRILELLARVDTLQQELATLKGARAEITLADNREQRSLDLARAQLQSTDDRFRLVMGQLGPLVPLVARVGIGAVAAKMGGAMPMPSGQATSEAAPGPFAAPHAPDGEGAASEPEVVQASIWTQHRIDEWKATLCEFIQASSPQTAAAFRFYVCETNVLGVFSAAPEALPDMVRALIAEAGPELVQRLQILTAASRPDSN